MPPRKNSKSGGTKPPPRKTRKAVADESGNAVAVTDEAVNEEPSIKETAEAPEVVPDSTLVSKPEQSQPPATTANQQLTPTIPSGPPNQTLYVQNLNDKIEKEELKRSLYYLFSTYGHIIDIVALKTPKMRGQAHLAFANIGSATLALKALQGFTLFGKEMRIAYAKGKSNAVAKLDGTYIMPIPSLSESKLPLAPFESIGAKRSRDDEVDDY